MARITRRRFLEDALWATASVGAFSAVRPARAQQAVAANDKLGVAIVGVHGQGNGHIGAFLGEPRCEILYIVDAEKALAEQRAAEVEAKTGRKPKAVQDMRRAFADPAVDVVSTATPNHWHALTAIWAMQAGKHVYVEKPLAYSIPEGRAIVAASRKYDRICQVGTQCRSHRALRDTVAFLQEGGIGEVNFARGLCYKRRKSIGALGHYEGDIPETLDFSLWSGPATYTSPRLTRPSLHYDWHWQRHYGNGDLGNQGPHQTDIARWGLGLDRHPETVLAYGGRLGYQAETNDPAFVDAGDVANTEVSIYNYGDKCIVFETRGLETPDLRGAKIGVIFYGSEGYLVNTSYTASTAFDLDGNKIREFEGGGSHFGNFLDCVVAGTREGQNGDCLEGHYSAAISHLGNISYYLGAQHRIGLDEARSRVETVESLDDNLETFDRTVQHLKDNGVDLAATPLSVGPLLRFDPTREVFPGNEAANALLTREYREGFVCPTADRV